LLPEAARTEVFWGQHIVHLSAAGRWSDAADSILKQISLLSEAGQDPVAELHAYAASSLRQAGRLEEAATHEAWVGKLFLGNSNLAMRIGNGYAYGEDYQRAGDWWQRAAIMADPESRDYADVLKLHSDVLLEQAKWKPAAAISEVLASIYAGVNLTGTSPLLLMRQRLHADMARALANLDEDREASVKLLADCHHAFSSDGGLADYFFPAVRGAGLIEEHERWFEKTWKFMEKTISLYPASDNTRNTAAWFASRSLLRLDEAADHLRKALASSPFQPAYLDTMAEIHFARGDREKALEWSAIAVNFAPADSQLRRQQSRFRFEPLPK
jgi:tetratricopeptide (TPR) repeat protein